MYFVVEHNVLKMRFFPSTQHTKQYARYDVLLSYKLNVSFKGLHPRIIAEGFDIAKDKALKVCTGSVYSSIEGEYNLVHLFCKHSLL